MTNNKRGGSGAWKDILSMANEFIEGFSDEIDIDVSVEQEMDYARKYFIANAAMTSSYVEYFYKLNAKFEQRMKQVRH